MLAEHLGSSGLLANEIALLVGLLLAAHGGRRDALEEGSFIHVGNFSIQLGHHGRALVATAGLFNDRFVDDTFQVGKEQGVGNVSSKVLEGSSNGIGSRANLGLVGESVNFSGHVGNEKVEIRGVRQRKAFLTEIKSIL